MGCCISVNERLPSRHFRAASELEPDFSSRMCSSTGSPLSVNDPIIIMNGITFNPLGHALYVGDFTVFKLLIEEKGSSCEAMECIFSKQGLNGLEILISKGHEKLLNYYLPIALLDPNNAEFFNRPMISKAVELNKPEIIKIIHSFFFFVNPPPAFNINHIDPITGENPAMVACRCLNLKMIEMLRQLEADFTLVNYRGLNALQIALIAMKKEGYNVEIVKFLLNHCAVNVVHEYERVLYETDDGEIVKVIEKELKKCGINAVKEDIVKNFQNRKGLFSVKKDSDMMITGISSISLIENEDFSISVLDESNIHNTNFM